MNGPMCMISFESDSTSERAIRVYSHVLGRTISLDKVECHLGTYGLHVDTFSEASHYQIHARLKIIPPISEEPSATFQVWFVDPNRDE